MISPNTRYSLSLLLALTSLTACETSQVEQLEEPVQPQAVSVEQIEILDTDEHQFDLSGSQEYEMTTDPFLRARILADLLYDASLAFDDDRLLLPAGDNAYDRYIEVLSIQADNQVALQGIADIADRYVRMANDAIRLGQYDDANEYLNRAATIEPDKPALIEARQVLAQQRSVRSEYFELDPIALNAKSLDIMSQLGSIGEYVRDKEATFVITARSDAEGRWIYQVMRDAVSGYRLRGNITLGSRPIVQLNVPQL